MRTMNPLPPTQVLRDERGDITIIAPLLLTLLLQQALAEEHIDQYNRLTGSKLIAGAAAGAWTLVNTSRTNLLNGTFDLDSDSFKVALFLSTSNIGAASTTYAGVTNEVANGVGYTTGGVAVTLTLSGTTTVTVAAASNPSWTASGGDIVARFAVIYEVSGNVLAYCLLDSTPANVTIQDGNSLAIDMDGTPALLTVA